MPRSVHQTRWFDRWASKQGLDAGALCEAVREMALGLFEADMGGGLLKKRVARQGQGKSSGYRTLVATNRASRWIFVFGFPKSARANIDKDEEKALKKLSGHLLSLSDEAVLAAQRAGELLEVDCHEKDQVADPVGRS